MVANAANKKTPEIIRKPSSKPEVTPVISDRASKARSSTQSTAEANILVLHSKVQTPITRSEQGNSALAVPTTESSLPVKSKKQSVQHSQKAKKTTAVKSETVLRSMAVKPNVSDGKVDVSSVPPPELKVDESLEENKSLFPKKLFLSKKSEIKIFSLYLKKQKLYFHQFR